MAAGNIWTRIQRVEMESPPPEHAAIPIHTLRSFLIALACGKLASSTPIIERFSLDADGQADLAAIIEAYPSGGTADQKQTWMHLLEAAFVLVQDGSITESQAKAALGIT